MLDTADKLLLQVQSKVAHTYRGGVYGRGLHCVECWMYLKKVEPSPDPVLAEVVVLTGKALVGYKEAMPEVVRIWEVESKSS